MAQTTNKNFLGYTGLTYGDILEKANSRLNKNTKLDNFRESALAQTTMEIFVAATDMVNYYLERRAEEAAGFDTAQLRSSIIALANQIGYVVQRPVPASSTLKIVLKGPLPAGISTGDTVTFQKFNTTFTYNNKPFVLNKTYTYTFTNEDIVNLTAASNTKVIDASYINDDNLVLNDQGLIDNQYLLPIEITQGSIKTQEFTPEDNSLFKKFTISDKTFSNYYGSEDLSYNTDTGEYSLEQGFTQVGYGTDTNNALSNLIEIDRRSLLTTNTVLNSLTNESDIPKVCYIRTRLDEGVDIHFGDNKVAFSPETGNVIVVKYLSTLGGSANETGTSDKVLNSSNVILVDNMASTNITSNVEFRFNSNIIDGADAETMDSIKLNAPSIFYSLDRLVTKTDYIAYLKSLTSPIDIRNAYAWGEQEEARAEGARSLQYLYNTILYSVIGPIYYKPTGGVYAPKALSATSDELKFDSVVLEGSDYLGTSDPAYLNIFTTSAIDAQIAIEEAYPSYHPITVLRNKLKPKAQLTTELVYVPPIIQNFYLDGKIYINSLSNINTTRIKVNNLIYDYLDSNADFDVSIYKSKIIKLIESVPEVINADISFQPVPSPTDIITTLADEFTDNNINIYTIVNNEIVALMTNPTWSYETSIVQLDEEAVWNPSQLKPVYTISMGRGGSNPLMVETDSRAKLTNPDITERWFYNTLIRNIYNALEASYSTYRDSDDFKTLVRKLNSTLKQSIRANMLDINGNIVNFSLKNEIPLIEITAKYTYR